MVWQPAAPCSVLLFGGEGRIKKETEEWEEIYSGQKESATDCRQQAELGSSARHGRARLAGSLGQTRFLKCICRGERSFALQLNNVEKSVCNLWWKCGSETYVLLNIVHFPRAPAKCCACPRCVEKGRTNIGDPSVLGFATRLIAFALAQCQL